MRLPRLPATPSARRSARCLSDGFGFKSLSMHDDADDIVCVPPSRTLNGALQGGVQGSNSSAHGSQYTDEAADQPQGHGDIRVGHCSTPLPHAFSCQLLSRSAATSVRGRSRQLEHSLQHQLQRAARRAADAHDAAAVRWSLLHAGDTVAACDRYLKPLDRLMPLHHALYAGAHCGAGRLCVGLPQARPAGALHRQRLPAVVQGWTRRHPLAA
jgi:hypothetical protein